jgi:hypothetical protein
MADEAVTAAGERTEHRRGASGWAGERVRAVDAGDDDRARWIEDEEPARPRIRERGVEPPGA